MKNIPVLYTPEMSAATASYSPSSDKPRQAVADWLCRDMAITIVAPEPIAVADLYLAHDRQHVDFILAGEKPNGFGNRDKAVADSLLYTSGAMFEAARLALANGKVACAPVSGFHHAGWNFAGGFCTFNGLMVTLYKLRDYGLIKQAMVLDCDEHFGNGTENIIELLGSRDWVYNFSQSFEPGAQAENFLQDLPIVFQKMVEIGRKPDILLYQAGADSHVDDPLGGYLTTEQMRRRDRIVFETCKEMDIPVCWNLAGGYQRDEQGSIEPVLALHRATMEECIAVFTGQSD